MAGKEQRMSRKKQKDLVLASISDDEVEKLNRRVADAVSIHKEGQLDEAARIYEEILAEHPCNVSALTFLGLVHHQKGMNADAERLIATAIAFDSNYIDAYNNLGNVFNAQGKSIEAGLCYQNALRINPDFVPAAVNLGVVFRKTGRLKDAAAIYEKLLEKDPDNQELLINCGMLLLGQGRVEKAIELLERAFELNPNPAARYALGMACYSGGKHEEARRIFNDWLEACPDDAVAKHMAHAYSGVDVPKRASSEYVRAIFDDFATSFEKVLEGLEYRVPALLEQLLEEFYGPGKRDLAVLDAGCGTGLCGSFLRAYSEQLIGVDLSPGMLKQAKDAGEYDELLEADLTEHMTSNENRFDLIVSGDTLCYFGDLAEVLSAAAVSLKEGGRMVFSLEQADEQTEHGFQLNYHGRYSHSKGYIEDTLSSAGFTAVELRDADLRREVGKPVRGLLVTGVLG